MKLTSLRLFGFKTFAEQTTLAFEPGITAIVGPNGSGKSNLVDAIRWVLGEQSSKSLRSTKTEDVIFAGNDRRKPLGMAEVTLTFANEDGALAVDAAEVQVTRRAYRAGEAGEYFINRQQVRLRDVVELLMGTGLGPGSYAIVSQGQIDSILLAKPAERRSLFEETAGINRFLARKNESLRRLEQTEQNAIRLSDLLADIAARIPELETQERRAKRYRKLSARLRDLEILSYVRASASRRREREYLVDALERFEIERVAAAARAATLDAELATLRTRALAHERGLESARTAEATARARLADLEARHAALAARREALEAQSASITDDRERAEAERAELAARIRELEEQLLPKERELEDGRERERTTQAHVAAARAELDRVFERLREVEAAAAVAAAGEAERRAQAQSLAASRERLERELAQAQDDAREREQRASERAAAAAAAHERAAALAIELGRARQREAAADRAAAAARERVEATQATLRATTGDLASAEARLHTIEELEANLEGHVPGTRAVLEAHGRGELGGIIGVVSRLVRVEERYARALDVAFGAGLSNIVTERAEDAERAIAFLRGREAGRATFLPLDVLGSRSGRAAADAPHLPGVLGWAHALVDADAAYRGIVAFLVGRILVVESLDVAIRLVRGDGVAAIRDSIVTLDGDEIRGGGAMTGGRYARERSILSRQAQARSLRAAMPELRAAHERAEAAVADALESLAATTRECDEARAGVARLGLAERDALGLADGARGDAERLETESNAAAERARDLAAELDDVRERLARIERPALDSHDADAQRERLEEEMRVARAGIAAAQDGERAVAAQIGAVREAVASLAAQRDGAAARLALLDADRERAAQARTAMTAELTELAERLASAGRDIGAARSDVERSAAHAIGGRDERDALAARVGEVEASLRAAHAQERDTNAAGESSRVRLAEVDAELGMLTATFAQHPATEAECADVEQRYADETGDVAADLARLRDDLTRYANVNLNAESERSELSEREAFLQSQLDDLARARETLMQSIHEIEASSQAQFNETFAAVKAAFETVFPRLFPGGEAKMWQTNPESLAETGIEIAVQPPGKKMMHLAALSGGERAMTSAALIFALINVRPSPFYLLDEVDAALDDANVDRLSTLVREVADHAQLLLVTHNKKTMELAQRMYGVTMAEPGISSIVAARLDGEPRERALETGSLAESVLA